MRARGGKRSGRATPALLAATLLALTLVPLAAPPASAIGASVDVNVHPAKAVGTPSPGQAGPANLSADATVFGGSISSGTLVWSVTTSLGWDAVPSTYSQPITSGGGQFTFDFQVMVPTDAAAGVDCGVQVTAQYRVGPATIATGLGGATVEAGKFFAASARPMTDPGPMSPGQTYLVDFDIKNTGNAGATMTFHWADPDLNSRLKADFVLPQSLSIAGNSNATAEFRITPQGTTPAGKYSVPVEMILTDRTGNPYGQVNFTVNVEFDNLPIYPGILPRLDLQGIEAILGWVGVIFVLWLLGNAGIAFARRGNFDPEDGLPFVQAYTERLSNTFLYRGLRRALGGGKRRKRRRARRADGA